MQMTSSEAFFYTGTPQSQLSHIRSTINIGKHLWFYLLFFVSFFFHLGIWEMSIYILGIPSLLLLIPCIVFLIYKYKRLGKKL